MPWIKASRGVEFAQRRTARGSRLELDGVFDEELVLEAWQKLHADISKQGGAVKL